MFMMIDYVINMNITTGGAWYRSVHVISVKSP